MLPLASTTRTLACGAVALVALLALGRVIPDWLVSLATLVFANGLAALGLLVMVRCGTVSFGQGLVFAAGGYAAALLFNQLGVTDIAVLCLSGGVAGVVIILPFAPLLARYRGIFFAMLTLALSMVFYGLLMKTHALGGSDGFNIGRGTLFGWQPPDGDYQYVMWGVAATLTCISAALVRIYFDSQRGLLSLGVRENELRVEYLGTSVTHLVAFNTLIAAALGGLGGALTLLSLGHIDPHFAFWSTSGELVFVAILAGFRSVSAVFVAALVLELVRSYSSTYFPSTWQMLLGIFLLLVIRFLPDGLGSLVQRVRPLRRRTA